MTKEPKKLNAHVFICTNERPEGHPRGCCHAKDSQGLLEKLKLRIADQGLAGQVRAQRAGCLDTCEYGVSLVIYPQNYWYGQVQESDLPEIVESLTSGKPVERLLIPGK